MCLIAKVGGGSSSNTCGLLKCAIRVLLMEVSIIYYTGLFNNIQGNTFFARFALSLDYYSSPGRSLCGTDGTVHT